MWSPFLQGKANTLYIHYIHVHVHVYSPVKYIHVHACMVNLFKQIPIQRERERGREGGREREIDRERDTQTDREAIKYSLFLPFPHFFHKFLPPHVVPGHASLSHQPLFHHHLSGNPCVVAPGNPHHRATPHPVPEEGGGGSGEIIVTPRA